MRLLGMCHFALALAAAVPAAAQDRCSDVLTQSGVMQQIRASDNSFLKQYEYLHYLDKSASESASSTGLAGEYGSLGASYDSTSKEKRRRQIEKTHIASLERSHDVQIALASGDPVIVEAWRACMANRGGIAANFEAHSGRDAVLTLRWHALAGIDRTRLTETVRLPPGVTIAAGGDCLQKGRVLTSVPCLARLKLPEASTPLLIVMNAQNDAVTAYLPPRMKLIRETRSHVFTPAQTLSYARRGDYFKTFAVTVEPDEAAGWRFEPSTANFKVTGNTDDERKCLKATFKANPFMFRYSYRFSNDDNAATLRCQGHPYIRETREVWVPMP